MKLVGRKQRKRRRGRRRRTVKNDEGSLGSCFSHKQQTKHIRGHSWQKHQEEGWDGNNKQIMFMESNVYPTYLIAVCMCEMFLHLLTESQRQRLTPGPTSGGPLGKIKYTVAAMGKRGEEHKKAANIHFPWDKQKHFNAHTVSHTQLSFSLISTSRHWPAGYSSSRLYSLLPHIHSQPSPTTSSCGRRLDFQAQRTSTQRKVSWWKPRWLHVAAYCFTLLLTVEGSVQVTVLNQPTQYHTTHQTHLSVCSNEKAQPGP